MPWRARCIPRVFVQVSVRRLMRRRMQTGDLDARGADGKQQTPCVSVNYVTTLISLPQCCSLQGLTILSFWRSFDAQY